MKLFLFNLSFTLVNYENLTYSPSPQKIIPQAEENILEYIQQMTVCTWLQYKSTHILHES